MTAPSLDTRRLLKAIAFADVLGDAGCDADAVDRLDDSAWEQAILVLRSQGFRTRMPSAETKQLVADALRHRHAMQMCGSAS